VLLQHAAFYDRLTDPRPALFITVSPRLKNELKQKYEELTPIHGACLPKTIFFSFQDFIADLLKHYQVQDFQGKGSCTFQGYIFLRKSRKEIKLEPHLLENEIGGVILGSVAAARQSRALSRDQYLQDKRSNIPNNNKEGRQCRELVFDEYERYSEWKRTNRKFDIHDVVLCLLKEKQEQLFASGKVFLILSRIIVPCLHTTNSTPCLAYLDEVQDLSHAAIFLICSIAGRDHQYWVCGGDPAQVS